MISLYITPLAVLLFPAAALIAVDRWKAIGWLSPVAQCFLFGALLANLPGGIVHNGSANAMMMIAVPIGIPLLLFATDFVAWTRLARATLVGFLSAIVSSMVMAVAAGLLIELPGEESWKAAGMLVGTYTGGTANMSAIGWALGVREETFMILNAIDLLYGGLFLLFLMTIAKPWLGRFLPPFKGEGVSAMEQAHLGDPMVWRRLDRWKPMMMGLGAAILTVVLSGALAFGLTRLAQPTLALGKIPDAPLFNSAIIIAICTISVGASFFGPLRRLEGVFGLGEYFILMFCVAVGTQAEVARLAEGGAAYLAIVGVVMFGAIALHLLLARLLRVDVDTAIITSCAAIYGPAFIGPVAKALKNREIIVSGIVSAVVGVAVGTQLGLAVAYLLKP